MTAPRPEIQRWDCGLAASEECGDWGDDMVVMREDETGKYILYSDHLRAVTRAKIEVLKEMPAELCPTCATGKPYPHKRNSNPYNHVTTICKAEAIHIRIAALRKELEG